MVEHSWQDTSVVAGDKTICLLHMDDEEVTEENQDEQLAQQLSNATLIAAAPELQEALKGLMENPSIALEDKIYDVRDREGKGWDGPDVIAWGKAIDQAAKLLKRLS